MRVLEFWRIAIICLHMLEVGAVACWPRILEAGAEDRLLAKGRDFGAADRLHAEDRRNCRWCPKLLDASKLDAWLAFWALRQESGDARTCYSRFFHKTRILWVGVVSSLPVLINKVTKDPPGWRFRLLAKACLVAGRGFWKSFAGGLTTRNRLLARAGGWCCRSMAEDPEGWRCKSFAG